MNTDQWLKVIPIVTTIGFGGSTLWLAIRQHLDGNKNARREEYKFAKLFFDELRAKPEMHSFARKKGFQAIGRNQDLPPSVIEHLMTLRDPVTALSDYESSRGYLKNSEVLGRRQLDFASAVLFSTEKRRNIISVTYFICAIMFYLLAFTPWLLFSIGNISVSFAIKASIVFSPVGLTIAVFTFREFLQLRRAIRLVKTQNNQADEYEVAPGDQD
ncbi:hypothetical protein AAKU55_004595 [Oxalobacteraceae bacterium GrIS 1.11]